MHETGRQWLVTLPPNGWEHMIEQSGTLDIRLHSETHSSQNETWSIEVETYAFGRKVLKEKEKYFKTFTIAQTNYMFLSIM